MLSVVLYGRNDSYGYNLHKRAAISLNCLAELLTEPGDEILFTDYNTPDDFPTFPEAIQDMLTPRVKRLLRVLRVRPHQHFPLSRYTPLAALEPIARNVAIRRSSPNNRWVLSTNTDMVFVPQESISLSEIVSALPDAYYHLPRFEVPESLWESLDRSDPISAIAAMGEWGRAFHLNEIVSLGRPEIKYDAPGDFQLVMRSDLWRINGFHEGMLLGWHVDSNLAKRLYLLPRQLGDVIDKIYGYHCAHQRELTSAHGSRAVQNDIRRFLDDVMTATVPEQMETWGLAAENVEEIKLGQTSSAYVEALRSVMPVPLVKPTEISYTNYHHGLDYSVDHVLPYLAAIFASYPPYTALGWFGGKKSLIARFAALWRAMGFSEPISVFEAGQWLGPNLPPGCADATEDILDERCQVFVFDFGPPESHIEPVKLDAAVPRSLGVFRRVIELERRRLSKRSGPPRRFIGVDTVVDEQIDAAFNSEVLAPRTPLATRIRQGFVSKGLEHEDFDCMSMMAVGTAGVQGPSPQLNSYYAVHAKPAVAGFVVYGPYVSLPAGHYEAILDFYSARSATGAGFRVEVTSELGNQNLAHQWVKPHRHLRRLDHALRQRQGPLTCVIGFDVPTSNSNHQDVLEIRVWSPGTISFCVVGVRIRQIAAFSQVEADAILGEESATSSP